MSVCTCRQCRYARKHPKLEEAPRTEQTFERERFLRVVSMDEASARAFAMPDAVKTICVGQADPTRYRFGARNYLLFQSWDDYLGYLRDQKTVCLSEGVQHTDRHVETKNHNSLE